MRWGSFLAFATVALVFGTAPTVGDVGGCGVTATDLNESRFASARKKVDCARCTECGIATQRCKAACDPTMPSDVGFESTCRPLLHDGGVCIDALQAASCADYAAYVDDNFRAVPTECEFCRGDAASGPTFTDGG